MIFFKHREGNNVRRLFGSEERGGRSWSYLTIHLLGLGSQGFLPGILCSPINSTTLERVGVVENPRLHSCFSLISAYDFIMFIKWQ